MKEEVTGIKLTNGTVNVKCEPDYESISKENGP